MAGTSSKGWQAVLCLLHERALKGWPLATVGPFVFLAGYLAVAVSGSTRRTILRVSSHAAISSSLNATEFGLMRKG